MSLEARFWAKVDRSGGPEACWPWTGTRLPKGYGRIKGPDRAMRYTTHVALELDGRPRPHGAFALHSCDNPPCCNPRHLRWGTAQENAAERDGKGRTRTFRGAEHGRAKLSDAEVQLARLLCALGARHKDVAEWLGMSRSYVGSLAAGDFRKGTMR